MAYDYKLQFKRLEQAQVHVNNAMNEMEAAHEYETNVAASPSGEYEELHNLLEGAWETIAAQLDAIAPLVKASEKTE